MVDMRWGFLGKEIWVSTWQLWYGSQKNDKHGKKTVTGWWNCEWVQPDYWRLKFWRNILKLKARNGISHTLQSSNHFAVIKPDKETKDKNYIWRFCSTRWYKFEQHHISRTKVAERFSSRVIEILKVSSCNCWWYFWNISSSQDKRRRPINV